MQRIQWAGLAVMAGAACAQGQTWNVGANFDPNQNPSSPYMYQETPTPLPSTSSILSNSTDWGTGNAIRAWTGPALGDHAWVGRNQTAGTYSLGSDVHVAPGQFVMGPGPTGQYAMVVWFAPVDSWYHFAATFTSVFDHPGWVGATADVHVGRWTQLFFSGLIEGYGNAAASGVGSDYGPSPSVSWAGVEYLYAGQAAIFLVGDGGNGNFGDVVALDATITLVPAPGVMCLLALAGLGIGRRRR